MEEFTSIWAMLFRSWHSPPPESLDLGFLDASQWARDYLPTGQDEVYALISPYAQNQYDYMVAVSDALDKKADDQLRYMWTLSAGLIAAWGAKWVVFERPCFAFIGLILASLALVTAFVSKRPVGNTTPMNPRGVLAVADHKSRPSKPQLESVIAASYHVAIVGMKILTKWKAGSLNLSFWLFVAASLFLLLAIIHI